MRPSHAQILFSSSTTTTVRPQLTLNTMRDGSCSASGKGPRHARRSWQACPSWTSKSREGLPRGAVLGVVAPPSSLWPVVGHLNDFLSKSGIRCFQASRLSGEFLREEEGKEQRSAAILQGAPLENEFQNGKEEVIQAWYMDDSEEDQRLPHHREPKEFIPLDKLSELGIVSWRLNADDWENDENLKNIREARGYSYMDIWHVCPEKVPNYEVQLKNLFGEHLHTDEEIRFFLEGSGYFDVRDQNDQWIRIAVKKGGMIVLPAGMYHRFTLDSDNYFKAMRLFVGEPVWTPYIRPHDHLPARKEYVQKFINRDGNHVVEAR